MNRRERLMCMVGVVLLGAVCFKFFIFDPQQVVYTALVQTRDDAAAQLRRNQEILRRADQVRLRYGELEAHLASVEAKLPKDSEIPALLTAMERFTKRLGMSMVAISPGALQPVKAPEGAHPAATADASAKTAPYSSMPVRLTVTATFPRLVRYFEELRDFPRLIVVDNFTISPNGIPQLTVSMDTEIYVLAAPQAPTSPATTSPPTATPAAASPPTTSPPTATPAAAQ